MDLSIQATLLLPQDCPCTRSPDFVICRCEPREFPVDVMAHGIVTEEPKGYAVELTDVEGLPAGWTTGDLPTDQRFQLEDLLEAEAALCHRRRKSLPDDVMKVARHLRISLDTAVPTTGATELDQVRLELELRKLAMGFVLDRLVALAIASGADEGEQS